MLLYHRVMPGRGEGRSPQNSISERHFRSQLEMLDRWGYTPITFRDFTMIRNGELMPPRKPIILTFDDGYKDTYEVAFPVLQEFGMKVVVFVLGDPGVRMNVWDGGRPIPLTSLMAERELLELHLAGFEIGSHSLTHPRLTELPKEMAWEQISRSRMKLEITLNARVSSFSYPYGLLNPTLKRMVAEAGYRYACSVWSGPTHFNEDPFEIRRIEVGRSTTIAEFAVKVIGPYPSYHQLRSRAKVFVRGREQSVHTSQAKTLLVVSAGLGWPDRVSMANRESEDRSPRLLPLIDAMNADILDEQYLASAPRWRASLYTMIGVNLAQVFEALMERKRYDVILSWAEHLGLPLAGLFAAMRSGTPHVSIFSWISKPKKARILKLVHRGIDRIILMSSAQRDFAVSELGIPPSKISLLRWPVDEKYWRSLHGTKDMICAVGREMRDYTTLVESLRTLDIRCHIAAGGQLVMEKDDAWRRIMGDERALPSHITTGRMDFEELRRLYDRSRFVVIPLMETDTDNGTTSILEAMATGNAVICSRVHGQRDVLRDGETGIFVPPRDPRALRDAIEHLWNNPDKAREMGNRAREYIERHHTLDAWVGHVRLIVDDVLAERKRQPDVGRHGWHRHHKPQIAEKGTECLPTVEKSPAEGFVP